MKPQHPDSTFHAGTFMPICLVRWAALPRPMVSGIIEATITAPTSPGAIPAAASAPSAARRSMSSDVSPAARARRSTVPRKGSEVYGAISTSNASVGASASLAEKRRASDFSCAPATASGYLVRQ